MPTEIASRAGNSGAEERFIQLFCDAFGPEKDQYVYLQFPFVDIYGGHRTIDFALNSSEGRIAIEVDGLQINYPRYTCSLCHCKNWDAGPSETASGVTINFFP